MPIISVITPVFDGGDAYLADTYESVASQRLPDGWSLQWCVQEDGKTGKPLNRLPDLPWISKDAGRCGGAARARTLALPRAEGLLVRTLDADDLFPDEHTLARDIEALAASPDLGWTVAPALDLYPDGRLVPGPNDPPPGRLPAGFLADGLRAGSLPVMGTTATIYKELVLAHGGWPAIPAFEDVGPLLAAEAVVDGWMQEKPGEIYRKHPGQSTEEPEYKDDAERATRIGIVLSRADAIRSLGWRWQPREPVTV
ncbi:MULTISPECIES: glycosyltransferase family 2 protein [Streptomycetaceae]|uniref:GltA n=1 Tax=Streptantibioticus cattleyicolor (strain ATCC 35852 / DSM 46488 / JCM 4925 / NBRC 14057 / NRRL 8057) TaxID=1003195 RepID=F8JYB0_STREN|nr:MULTISPECIES: glycosyltransferase [Streptomycetaceae]AEW95905.1 GltA [Streptantibioticus cattleyicolor NRRL 8057 = DSM 46488]MYS60441.1 GltA [Streptomyces sp. SID5468]CCB76240.1 GltA [Streptantibioticus cattleyicolor NRRL 8057 = DSM 46488]